MLYERWQRIARDNQNLTALTDFGTDRRWTFAELAAAADSISPDSAPIQFPQGAEAGFILDVLKAWRSGAVVCPLESGQSAPALAHPPEGIIHLKTTSATSGAA